MPKTKVQETQEFNKEEWFRLVKERVMQAPWGSGRLWTDGVITVEVVRIGETEDIMLRIRIPNVKNAIKLTRKEHVTALLSLAEAVAKNENHLKDKLEAIREMLRSGRGAAEEEL
jgi:hypothetical protein